MKKKTSTANTTPSKRPPTAAEHYLYTVGWSDDNEVYVARVAEFPSLSAHGSSQETALRSLQRVVKAVLKDMAVSKEPIPL